METNHPEPSVETSQHRLSDLRLLLRQLTSRRPRLPLLRTSQRALHAAPRNAPALRTSVLDRIRRRATQASTNLCLIGGMAEVTVEPFPPLGQLGVPPPAPEKRCTMCTATAKEVGAALIRPCSGCVMLYCSDCMRDQFVLAIRESDPISFPPECDCGCIIPLHAAIHHLDLAFQFRYRARFDVWSAAFPLYCPVPTCSAFIHDRDLSPAAIAEDGNSLVKRTPVYCPNNHSFCSTCKQSHAPDSPCLWDGDAVKNTAAVEAALKKWGYKRCPCCHAGVKRMLGCSHIQCHCGAHWCWGCLREINKCRDLGGCGDDDEGFDEGSDGDDDDDDDEEEHNGDDGDDHDRGHEDEDEDEGDTDEPNVQVGSGNSQHTSELSGDVGSNHDLDDMDRESLDLNEEPAEPLDGEFGKCAHLFVVYEPHGLTEQAMSAKIDFLINNVTTLTESELEENQPEEQLVPPEDMECHRCWKKVYWKPKAPLERPFSSLELAYAPHTFGRYLRRSFVASNIPDGVSLKDIRTKLTRIVKDVTRSGSLCTIDWDKVPLPPQLTLRKHSGFRKNFDFSQSNQTLTVPVEGAASNADELPNETPTAYVCDCASCGYLVCFDCQHLLTRRLVAAEATDVEEEGRIL